MPFHVQGQVVRAGEAAVTHSALEGLRSGVFPEMASQLVGAGEAPLAPLPRAAVRLLSCSTTEQNKSSYGDNISGEKKMLSHLLIHNI